MKKTTRRSFLKRYGTIAAGSLVVPTIIPACARGKNGHIAPSETINMALIGAGNQAGNDVKEFIDNPLAQNMLKREMREPWKELYQKYEV